MVNDWMMVVKEFLTANSWQLVAWGIHLAQIFIIGLLSLRPWRGVLGSQVISSAVCGTSTQKAKQQQRLEAQSAQQERQGRGCRVAVEAEQVDAGLGATKAIGCRARVAAITGQRG